MGLARRFDEVGRGDEAAKVLLVELLASEGLHDLLEGRKGERLG
jgi:hypothetical protein